MKDADTNHQIDNNGQNSTVYEYYANENRKLLRQQNQDNQRSMEGGNLRGSMIPSGGRQYREDFSRSNNTNVVR